MSFMNILITCIIASIIYYLLVHYNDKQESKLEVLQQNLKKKCALQLALLIKYELTHLISVIQTCQSYLANSINASDKAERMRQVEDILYDVPFDYYGLHDIKWRKNHGICSMINFIASSIHIPRTSEFYLFEKFNEVIPNFKHTFHWYPIKIKDLIEIFKKEGEIELFIDNHIEIRILFIEKIIKNLKNEMPDIYSNIDTIQQLSQPTSSS